MNPEKVETYNLLANLFFKKEDLVSSKKCLEDGLKKSKTKRGLRYYSLVLRGTGTEPIIERFQKSIEVAKQAVGLDLKDGFSWCMLKRYPRKLLFYVFFQR